MVSERDDTGGYLKTRLRHVKRLVECEPGAVWLNQYADAANVEAHYESTAGEIIRDVGERPDCFVAAVSTTGTIIGVGRRLKEHFPDIRVVAVDTLGSAIFGGPTHERNLPGIGCSIVPPLLDQRVIDDVVHVREHDAIVGAHRLVESEAIFAGGSTGAVVAALGDIVAEMGSKAQIVTVFADRGERYGENVYFDGACRELEPI